MGISLVLLGRWPLRQDDRDQMGGSGQQPLARAANPYGGPRALPQQTKLTVRFTDRSL